jgi:hypothetical protein
VKIYKEFIKRRAIEKEFKKSHNSNIFYLMLRALHGKTLKVPLSLTFTRIEGAEDDDRFRYHYFIYLITALGTICVYDHTRFRSWDRSVSVEIRYKVIEMIEQEIKRLKLPLEYELKQPPTDSEIKQLWKKNNHVIAESEVQ